MDIRVSDIAKALEVHGATLHGNGELRIQQLASIEQAQAGSITFISNRRFANLLENTSATCVIAPPDLLEQALQPQRAVITATNPYAMYAWLSQWWRTHVMPKPSYHIHPTAFVDEGASVHASAIIGPLCVVEKGAYVGAGTWLKARVYLGENCRIGQDCIVQPGAVIGGDGFGFAPDGQGEWIKIEQLGAVRIGDRVEIGANTCVDRGAINDTIIEDGVKLDNLIQIAHNVHLGRNVAMAANAGIAGSTTVEEGVTIGGAANIMGHITLGKGVHISATTFASRSITKPGTYSGHFPFDENANWEKNAAVVKQLHKLRARVRAMEQQLLDENKP